MASSFWCCSAATDQDVFSSSSVQHCCTWCGLRYSPQGEGGCCRGAAEVLQTGPTFPCRTLLLRTPTAALREAFCNSQYRSDITRFLNKILSHDIEIMVSSTNGVSQCLLYCAEPFSITIIALNGSYCEK